MWDLSEETRAAIAQKSSRMTPFNYVELLTHTYVNLAKKGVHHDEFFREQLLKVIGTRLNPASVRRSMRKNGVPAEEVSAHSDEAIVQLALKNISDRCPHVAQLFAYARATIRA